MRRYLGIALFLLLCTSAFGRQRVQGNCEQGGTTITTSGIASTQKVQQSFPGCTITVYLTATVTLAPAIYSDNAGTPLSNPFTASVSDGRWAFYVDDGVYDVQLSGAGIPTPFTLGAITVNSGNSTVSGFPGADIGAQINACLLALPATGGICDATSITGTVSNATSPFAGLAGKSFTLMLGYITINDSSCWLFPNDSASPPKQGVVRLLGVGYDAASTGNGKTPTSGTIVNSSCNSGVAKFDTRGGGFMEVRGITFMDTNGDALPFWQTTNTILYFHDNQCYGSKSGTLNDQDCLVLGGTTITIDGSSTASFQGYGTIIEHNYFNKIRRAVYGRVYANGITVNANTVWKLAGSNLGGGAAIEFDAGADPSSSNSGNVVTANLIEVANYPYGIKLTQTGVNNNIYGNNFYDPTATFLAGIRFETNSIGNMVLVGFQPDAYQAISEDSSSLGGNTVFTSHVGQTSTFPNKYKFTAGTGIQMVHPAVGGEMYNAKVTTTNDEFYNTISTAGKPQYNLFIHPAGGAGVNLASWEYYSATQAGLKLQGSLESFLEAVADLKVRAAAGTNLWLGTNANADVILIGDALLRLNANLTFKTDNTFDIGAAGANRPRTIYPGTGIGGVTTNSNAAAGIVGEYVATNVGGVNLTTVTPATVASIALTAGDWDVSSSCYFTVTVGVTYLRISNFTTPATVLVTSDGSTSITQAAGGSLIGSSIIATGTLRASLAAPATYYASVDSSFGAGTVVANCTIRARRVR